MSGVVELKKVQVHCPFEFFEKFSIYRIENDRSSVDWKRYKFLKSSDVRLKISEAV